MLPTVLSTNFCNYVFQGYANYAFPEEWGNDVTLYPGLLDGGAVPPDGTGFPEQVRNVF